MDGGELKSVLREAFEARVMNHGDYSLVYGQPSGPGPVLVLGYRRTSLELLLCPVDLADLGAIAEGTARPAGRVTSIDLTNVATVADTGTGYQVETVTGFRAWFEVEGTARIPVADAAGGPAAGTVLMDQEDAAEDFHQFMGHFMDTLDAFYQVPDVAEILQGAYMTALAA
ncbi:hypothetical protein [Citricoccus sp. SGAir0253]|uniref:hypothetical protein n=1 Tax=Citricoccus sp. SGAir0253 TaxID=2567881 RepID=UPI001FEEBB4F|nr:hypothetical protein [Citricoccus sp. SGAir0253]